MDDERKRRTWHSASWRRGFQQRTWADRFFLITRATRLSARSKSSPERRSRTDPSHNGSVSALVTPSGKMTQSKVEEDLKWTNYALSNGNWHDHHIDTTQRGDIGVRPASVSRQLAPGTISTGGGREQKEYLSQSTSNVSFFKSQQIPSRSSSQSQNYLQLLLIFATKWPFSVDHLSITKLFTTLGLEG